jgi:hypothetical protein
MTNSPIERASIARAISDRTPIIPITPFPTSNTPFDAYIEVWAILRENSGIADSLLELTDHESNDSTLSIVLDWAMHLRTTKSLNWDDAVQAAMIAYYG